MSATFTNLTRSNEIGANSYFLQMGETGIVLDAGMHPKYNGWEAVPDLALLRNRRADAIFLSHAHHDHVGAMPLVMSAQTDARVFMGDATYHLAEVLLHNSVNVMKRQREEAGVSEYPLYGHGDVDKMVRRWQACHLTDRWSLLGHPSELNEKIWFRLHHAGHILGSVAVEIVHPKGRILYSGDINLSDQTILRRATLPERDIDTLIIETTRGANPSPEGDTREKIVERLLQAIGKTFERGGAVLIPVFAMGKCQEALTLLHEAMAEGKIPPSKIYIGGLSKSFSYVYDRTLDYDQRRRPALSIMDEIKPEVMDGRTASSMKPKKGHIYLISSGMMTENTLSNLFGQRILARENDSILFIGYSDPESPAGRLQKTPRGGRVVLCQRAGDQPVLCHVEYFDLTAHARREDILNYILTLNPRNCLLVHGDAPALEWFRQELHSARPNMRVTIPKPGEEISIAD